MNRRLKKTKHESFYILLCSTLLFITKLYGGEFYEDRRAVFQNFLPDSFISFFGVLSIVFGAFRAWQKKKCPPPYFFWRYWRSRNSYFLIGLNSPDFCNAVNLFFIALPNCNDFNNDSLFINTVN